MLDLDGFKLLAGFLRGENKSSKFEINSFALARLMRKEVFLPYRPTSSYNTIAPGNFIAAKVEHPFRDLQRANSNLHLVRFYCVRFILQQYNGDENSPAWSLVSPVVQISNVKKYSIDDSAKLICIELTTSVRRVGKCIFVQRTGNMLWWSVNYPRDMMKPICGMFLMLGQVSRHTWGRNVF